MKSVNENKWNIFIVSHKQLFSDMYEKDKKFGSDHYKILNVGSNKEILNNQGLEVVNQYELKDSIQLGKTWAESEGIYNIWRSGIWKDSDFIGFIHYDSELRVTKDVHIFPKTNITARVDKYLTGKKEGHISFENHPFKWDFEQNIMADESRPDEDCGDGLNCFYYLLDDYNRFFGTNHTIDDLMARKNINLCSCFMMDTKHFDEMMRWWDDIVKSEKLLVFDPERKIRKQGSLAERYFGVYLSLAYSEDLDLSLIHHWNDGRK